MKRIIIAAFIASMALGLGHASALGPDAAAACAARTDADGNGSCSATFLLEGEQGGRFVSLLGTWGNFIELSETGSVTLTWTDAEQNVVAEFTCLGFGLAAADATSALCSLTYHAESYVTGAQTLTVTASSENPYQDFHGQLTLSQEGELI